MTTPISLGLLIGPTYTKGLGQNLARNLSLSGNTVSESAEVGTLVGTFLGKNPNSTLSILNSDKFSIVGTQLLVREPLNFENLPLHSILVQENLSGARNSPQLYFFSITVTNVFEKPALQALTISFSGVLGIGIPVTGTINGLTEGSSLVVSGLPSGLSVVGNFISGVPQVVGPFTIVLTETLDDSPNSPRVSTVPITVLVTLTPLSLGGVATQTLESSIDILGTTSGSTLTATGLPSGLSILGRRLVGTTFLSGIFSISITESLVTSSNNPRTSPLLLEVLPFLRVPILRASGPIYVGIPVTIFFEELTPGSVISVEGVPPGMSLSGNTLIGTPIYEGYYELTLTETLPGAANSPRVSSLELRVRSDSSLDLDFIGDTAKLPSLNLDFVSREYASETYGS